MIRNLFLAVPALLLAACASTPTSPSVKPERTEAEAAEPAPVSTYPYIGSAIALPDTWGLIILFS